MGNAGNNFVIHRVWNLTLYKNGVIVSLLVFNGCIFSFESRLYLPTMKYATICMRLTWYARNTVLEKWNSLCVQTIEVIGLPGRWNVSATVIDLSICITHNIYDYVVTTRDIIKLHEQHLFPWNLSYRMNEGFQGYFFGWV
jgi:hypothetical protein